VELKEESRKRIPTKQATYLIKESVLPFRPQKHVAEFVRLKKKFKDLYHQGIVWISFSLGTFSVGT
jgi:hypothetical protein